MPYQWHAPMDPECPAVRKYEESLDDPITAMAGIGEELGVAFRRRHLKDCERCQEYGAANIEVI